jgi:hypothetical protein
MPADGGSMACLVELPRPEERKFYIRMQVAVHGESESITP